MPPARKPGRKGGPRVLVIGGGLAGMTTALNLATKVGCEVTLYEEKEMLGGNVASRRIGTYDKETVYYDVYPHMYQPWYHNFWRLMTEVGVKEGTKDGEPTRQGFRPFRSFFQLRPSKDGVYGPYTQLEDAYSASHLGQNLLSGVASPGDMLVFGYAGMDLIAERLNPSVRLRNMSLSGFLNARTYMTREALDAYETFITRIWAVPGYLASAQDCRTYLTFCLPTGDQPSWLTTGPASAVYLDKLEKALVREGVKIEKEVRIQKIECRGKRIDKILAQPTEFKRIDETWVSKKGSKAEPLSGKWDYVVLAVPPGAFNRLVSHGASGKRIVDEEPSLAKARRLGSQAVPILHLCFTKKLQGIPIGPVGLFGSSLNLAFTDISQVWGWKSRFYGEHTVLSVSCSDPSTLTGPWKVDAQKIIEQLSEYVNFKPGKKWGESEEIVWPPAEVGTDAWHPDSDVRYTMTRYHENLDAQLSLNAIGSEGSRPGAKCKELEQLVIAGDFCQHYAGMMTVESAVVSGLAAAREIGSKLEREHEPIEIQAPETWPDEVFVSARYAWAPSILAAKAWALARGEWHEAMPPVDVGAGIFGEDPGPGGETPSPPPSWMQYLLTPGLPPRRGERGDSPPDAGESLLSYFLVPGRSARHKKS